MDEIVLDPPPAVRPAARMSPVALLMPLMTVLAAGAMAVVYYRANGSAARGASPGVSMLLPVMMVVSAVGSIAYGLRGSGRSAELDEDRRTYLRYLDAVDDRVDAAVRVWADRWESRYPEPETLWAGVDPGRRRAAGDEDFGRVRVGVGSRAAQPVLVAPGPGPEHARDPVTAAAIEDMLARHGVVDGVPVTLDLLGPPVVHVRGPGDAAASIARAMLCQLTAWHDPATVAVTAAVRVGTADRAWDWLKWLPHHRYHGEPRGAANLVRVTDRTPVTAPSAGETVIVLGVAETVSVDVEPGMTLHAADEMSLAEARAFARRLARTGAARRAEAVDWPGLVGLGAALGSHDSGSAAPWPKREPGDRLRVPIGTSAIGEPVWLDLKEAARGGMGPHGLCVGATGSGKSEFLRTLVLGLAATHPPEDLNLILVDFKGGATFLDFDRLNHVAAVITNLAEEAHLVERMRDALSGEITRRQQVLRAAGNLADVAGYAAARAGGADFAPLPTLLIVVDEFAELLSAHPDFADTFVAIGRVGRSLGMHLLLASQRLDEGRLRGLDTHLSYRVCLKTFSASESRAVLGTAAAYEMDGPPGSALLKTGAGEMVGFRTAYASRPVPGAGEPSRASPRVAPFTAEPPPEPAGPATAGPRLVDVAVAALAGRGTPAHPVWSAPLTASPTLGELLAHCPELPALMVPMAVVDDPFAQCRHVLPADLRGAGGNVAVIGGPRAGKTTALLSLVLGLAATTDPLALAVYALDLGAGELGVLRGLPHVGAVAGRTERELVRRIVARVQAMVRERSARGAAGASDDPEVFLVVDGWAVLRQEFDGLDEVVSAIAAQGLAVGVRVVIAASRWADVRPALRDQLVTRFELRLGEPAESEMHRARARWLIGRPPGRGITRDGREFAIAVPWLAAAAVGADALAGAVADVAARHRGGPTAAPIALLPAMVPAAAVAALAGDRCALGLDEDDLSPVMLDFASTPLLLILGDDGCGKTATLRTLCRETLRTSPAGGVRIAVVDPRRTLPAVSGFDPAGVDSAGFGAADFDAAAGHAMSVPAARRLAGAVADVLRQRLPGDDVTVAAIRHRSWWHGPDYLVVVDDYDLVSGSAALEPLVDLLPHARDVGLRLVVARRSGGAARAMYDPLLAAMRESSAAGLVMSAGAEEGPLLGNVRPLARPPGRGVLVTRGRPDRVVQVGWVEPS